MKKQSILKLSVFAKCVRVGSQVNVLLYFTDIMSNQNCTSFVLEPITCPVIFLTLKILIGEQTGAAFRLNVIYIKHVLVKSVSQWLFYYYTNSRALGCVPVL